MKYQLTTILLGCILITHCGEKSADESSLVLEVKTESHEAAEDDTASTKITTETEQPNRTSVNLIEKNTSSERPSSQPIVYAQYTSSAKYHDYDTELRGINTEWREYRSKILNKFNTSMKSYRDASKLRGNLYMKKSSEFSSNKNNHEEELKETLKKQHEVQMIMTNKVFQDQLNGTPDPSSIERLEKINESINILHHQLKTFSKYYNGLQREALKKYHSITGSLHGINDTWDLLDKTYRNKYSDYLRKRIELAKKYENIVKDRPIEVSLEYLSKDEKKAVYGIFNSSPNTQTILSLKISTDVEKRILVHNFTNEALIDVEGKTIMQIPPYSMTFLYIDCRYSPQKITLHSVARSKNVTISDNPSPLSIIHTIQYLIKNPQQQHSSNYSYHLKSKEFSNFIDGDLIKSIKTSKSYEYAKKKELELLNEIVVSGHNVSKNTTDIERNGLQARLHELTKEYNQLVTDQRLARTQISHELDELRRSNPSDPVLQKENDRKYRELREELTKLRLNQQRELRLDPIYQEYTELSRMLYHSSSSSISSSKIKQTYNEAFSKRSNIIAERKIIDAKFEITSPLHSVYLDCVLKRENTVYFKLRNLSNKSIKNIAFSISTPNDSTSLVYRWNHNGTQRLNNRVSWKAGESRYFSSQSSGHEYYRLSEITEISVLNDFSKPLIFDNKEEDYLLQVDAIEN